MGKLYWRRNRHTSHPRDEYMDITNWKTIRYRTKVAIHYIEGCSIIVRNLSKPFGNDKIFIPGMVDLKRLIEISNSDTAVLETFFVEEYQNVERCSKCKGSGRFDWTNKVTNSRVNDFIRDPSVVIIYEPNYCKPSREATKYISPYLFISRTKLDETNGEVFCDHCLGTGMMIDGRHAFFSGFNNFKSNLRVIKWE
jgi:hypothetical protein